MPDLLELILISFIKKIKKFYIGCGNGIFRKIKPKNKYKSALGIDYSAV